MQCREEDRDDEDFANELEEEEEDLFGVVSHQAVNILEDLSSRDVHTSTVGCFSYMK